MIKRRDTVQEIKYDIADGIYTVGEIAKRNRVTLDFVEKIVAEMTTEVEIKSVSVV